MTGSDGLTFTSSNRPPHNSAGQAYLVRPGEDGEGVGPAVLLLHSWWGLTPSVKDLCNRLCDEGFVVLAPDLTGGQQPQTEDEAAAIIAEIDPNVTAGLIISSAAAARSASSDPSGPVAVVGFSMGASWALWVATRQPESFSKVVAFYGTQNIDFDDMAAAVQGHFATDDNLVDPDDLVKFESDLFELGREPEFWHYEASHWFAEAGVADSYDEAAAELAFERMVDFLRR